MSAGRLLVSLAIALTTLGTSIPAIADDDKPAAKSEKEKDRDKEKPRASDDETPIITHHELKIGGRTLKYTATAGLTPLRDSDGKTEARIFSIAYTADDVKDHSKRPLMFSFNGGPGSSSVWLHLGALGPKRVTTPEGPTIPAPPFRLVDNEQSWLDKTDIVFIDPVETGYSRAVKPELNKKFHGLKGDIASIGEFIRMYLSRSGRWTSPLYLVGESYGTTRAAGLAGHLADEGIAFNGIILISTVLDFQMLQHGRANDLPYVVYLPSFTASAWYHKKLPDDLQDASLRNVLTQAERWAETDYRAALARGDELGGEERTRIVKQLALYTGLSERFVDLNDLRISQSAFCKELLRDKRRSLGRFDSRYLGIDVNAGSSAPESDPSLSAVRPAYTATFNQYVRDGLGYKTDLPYHILGSDRLNGWDWGPAGSGYPETGSALREAMVQNPHLKVLVASGYYDLATPYASADATLAHLRLDPALRRNVRVETYEAGHMMYLHGPSLEKLKADAARFLDDSDGQ